MHTQQKNRSAALLNCTCTFPKYAGKTKFDYILQLHRIHTRRSPASPAKNSSPAERAGGYCTGADHAMYGFTIHAAHVCGLRHEWS